MERPEESPAAMFQRTHHMDEKLARALISGGVSTLEELAYVPIGELLGIPGLDEAEAQLFRKRARQYLLSEAIGNADDEGTVDA